MSPAPNISKRNLGWALQLRGWATRRLGGSSSVFKGLTALVLVAGQCAAETIRVTSWNLGLESENEATPAAIEEAAATLKALNPDVILLQRVKDWRMCELLTTALKPLEYHVLICSAFHGLSPGAAGQPQVAIFSKTKAYFTWADGWGGHKQQGIVHGIGFAAIQAGTQRVGFFTTLFGSPQTGEQLARQVLDQIDSIRHWETNQVEAFVVAASSGLGVRNPSRVLRRASAAFEKAGLINATATLPPDFRATLRANNGLNRILGDCIFAGPADVPSNTRVSVSQVSDHYPITSDIELNPDKVSLALDLRAETRREREAHTSLMIRTTSYWAGGTIALAILMAILLRRRRRRRLPVPTPRQPAPPLRVSPKPTPAQIRPIIVAERAASAPASDDSSPLARRPLRSTLRLQTPPRSPPPPIQEDQAPQSPPPDPPSSEPPPPGSQQGPVAVLFSAPTAVQTPLTRDPEVREGVIKELSAWLKQRLVGKLLSDRAQLMQAQQLATKMACTLDNRLSRIEAQIQQQNQAYIRRIEELNRELAAAREENRELILERIAQVKAEMEAARAKVLAEADLDTTRLRL
jgi:hypothetical protein